QRAWREVDRRAAQARGHVDVARTLVNLSWRADLRQAAVLDNADAGAKRHRLRLVVGDIEDRGAELSLDALELDAQFGPQLGVQRGKRLVHQVDGRRGNQGAADRHAPPLPAGKPGDPLLELLGDPQQRRDFVHPLSDPRFRRPPCGRAQWEGQIVEHREMRVERVLLEYEGDVALRRRGAGDILAGDADPPGVRLLEAGD